MAKQVQLRRLDKGQVRAGAILHYGFGPLDADNPIAIVTSEKQYIKRTWKDRPQKESDIPQWEVDFDANWDGLEQGLIDEVNTLIDTRNTLVDQLFEPQNFTEWHSAWVQLQEMPETIEGLVVQVLKEKDKTR